MPQMSGRELAEQLHITYQPIKVLFMSGYTDDLVVRHGLLAAKVNFLGKPFSAKKLAAKVREVLDAGVGTSAQPARTYYEDTHSMLARTLESSNSAASIRSLAQSMFAQGNVLGMMGEIHAAGELFARSNAIYQSLGDHNGQVTCLERLGWVARERGDAATAIIFLEESITLNRRMSDQQQIAWTLLTFAGVAILREDAASAESLIAQGIRLGTEGHDWIGWSFNHLGHVAQLRGEYDQAEQLHQKALTVFTQHLGTKSAGLTWIYQSLGEIALATGDPALARRWLCAGLRLSHELSIRMAVAWCLAGLGSALALDAAPERAARLWGAGARLRARLGCRTAPAARATYERLLMLARAQISAEAFGAAWAAGEAMSVDQAIVEAMGEV
jgi:tetratricopeptide (TPR) repeat protein